MDVCVLYGLHAIQHDLRSRKRVGHISRYGLEELDHSAYGPWPAGFDDDCSASLFVHSETVQV